MTERTLRVKLPGNLVEELTVSEASTYKELADRFQNHFDFPILGTVCDNKVQPLSAQLNGGNELEFFSFRDKDGRLIFLRSILFILVKASRDMFPHAKLHIEYSIGNGYYCYFEGLDWIKAEEIEELERRMRELIARDLPFIRTEVPTSEAVRLFTEAGMEDKVSLFSTRSDPTSSIYRLDDMIDYFYGYLAYSTSAIHDFKLTYYNRGIVLLLPDSSDPSKVPAFKDSPKFFNIITENKRWLDILELEDCGQLNEAIRAGRTKEVILTAESLHEKKLALIADEIHRRRDTVKIVSIAGPSSSGKTTSSYRLAVQLRVVGFKPLLISLDNYFIDREKTPVDAEGKHNYESLEAIDVALFNEQLNRLLQGKSTYLQKYDFITGKSLKGDVKYRLPEKGIIIVEGIHGLNPKLYPTIPYHSIYKIYVSALATLNIDNHNRIPTTDCRILRRIVRDSQFRGHNALETIWRWPSVRAGEEMNIFPYQERADMMFNSSLVYELAVMRKYAEPRLKAVPCDTKEYIEAKRLLKFLSFFEQMQDEFIPRNSLIREFIGGSIFDY